MSGRTWREAWGFRKVWLKACRTTGTSIFLPSLLRNIVIRQNKLGFMEATAAFRALHRRANKLQLRLTRADRHKNRSWGNAIAVHYLQSIGTRLSMLASPAAFKIHPPFHLPTFFIFPPTRSEFLPSSNRRYSPALKKMGPRL